MPLRTIHLQNPGDWVVLLVLAGALIAADLLVWRRAASAATRRNGLSFAACLGAGLGFGAFLWFCRGADPAQRYLAGYLTEVSLSVDNLLVFTLVFERFGIGGDDRRRILFWGLLGAVWMRIGLIAAGTQAVARFHWVLPLLGALIIGSAAKLALGGPGPAPGDPAARGPARTLLRWLPVSGRAEGGRFFTRQDGRWLATPLLAALLVLETADLLFAIDSIPAVIGITRTAFIAAASNTLAIVGLRSLYFILSDGLARLRFLRPGLALLLLFVGLRLLADPWIRLPASVSLLVIGSIVGAALALSLLRPRRA